MDNPLVTQMSCIKILIFIPNKLDSINLVKIKEITDIHSLNVKVVVVDKVSKENRTRASVKYVGNKAIVLSNAHIISNKVIIHIKFNNPLQP